MTLRTEFEFTLPRGYIDGDGNLHRKGVMRLANASDEIAPMKGPPSSVNPAYLAVILLSRVVTQVGDVCQINPKVIKDLVAADFAYLEDFYRCINETGTNRIHVVCPECQAAFEAEVNSTGWEL